MGKAPDPYYNRKPVPGELIQDVGPTGMDREEEYLSREKKFFHMNGDDVRNFFNPRDSRKNSHDPFYQRKQIPDAMLEGVGVTGLTQEEEYLNRERKYSSAGGDVRRFSNTNDPYYNKKSVDQSQLVGVGELNMTPAEQFEKRDRKLSAVQFSDDPFQQLTGQGHRTSSISGAALGNANLATQRRRSSATAPNVTGNSAAHHHSGFDGNKLEPIESRVEGQTNIDTNPNDRIMQAGTVEPVISGQSSNATGSTAVGTNGHATFHDVTTVGSSNGQQARFEEELEDPDSVAPDVIR